MYCNKLLLSCSNLTWDSGAFSKSHKNKVQTHCDIVKTPNWKETNHLAFSKCKAEKVN